jgi:nucleoid-associated protein YgaU
MDLIIKANPSLQNNPDMVVEGRKYVIPPGPAAGAATVAQVDAAATTAAARTASASLPKPATAKPIPVTDLVDTIPAVTPASSGSGYWYVVKENDNLWKIAAEQLGSGNAWTQIKELNQDVLKGGDNVHPNMRLRLPAKPLASAAE